MLEGLKGDAYLVARDLGLAVLAEETGVDKLVAAMRDHVFPSLEDEAQLLYHHGQKADGILARQAGESMFSYVSRRRRWWDTLQQLDSNTKISENMPSDLLLTMSGLDHDKQLRIKTTVGNGKVFEGIAQALIKQHPRIQTRERRIGDTERSSSSTGRKGTGKSKGRRPGFSPFRRGRGQPWQRTVDVSPISPTKTRRKLIPQDTTGPKKIMSVT